MLRINLFICLLHSFCYLSIAQPACSLGKQSSYKKANTVSPADIALMNQYDVTYYKLDLDVQAASLVLKGNVRMTAKALSSLSTVTLQLHQALTIDSIRINDSFVTFTRTSNMVTVQAKGTISTNSFFNLITYYHGTAPQSGSGAIGNGFNINAAKHVTWSLSEPYSALEWWPCKQVLTDKADSSDVWITTDSANKAGSNGLLQNTTTIPGGKVRYEWKSRYPIAYYLISVAVCPYQEYGLYAHPAGHDSILIQNYIYKDAGPEVEQSISFTPALIEMFSAKFGLYPFAEEKYGHCQSEAGGAMEHQTMTTIGRFNFDIVAHELAHQWFGDYVTCGNWRDIWLNEGFASYSEYIANEMLAPENTLSWLNTAMQAAGENGTIHVADSFNAAAIFSYGLTYKKGAMLLHMLRREFNNDSLFFAGIRSYLEANKYSNAVVPDFSAVMSTALGKNLNYFFDQWYYNPGHPVLSGTWNQVAGKVILRVAQTPSTGTTVFKTSLDVKFVFIGGDTIVRVWIDQASQVFEFNLPGKTVTSVRYDPSNHLLNEVFSIARDPSYMSVHGLANGSNILLFPNPAHDRLTIKDAAGYTATVYNLAGIQCMRMTIESDDEQIALHEFPAGLYVLRMERNGHAYSYKLNKQ